MKKIALMLCVTSGILFSSFSCNKEKEKEPTPTETSPYYFEFTLDGEKTKFASKEAQYSFLDPLEAGGYQMPNSTTLFPSLELNFKFKHNPSNAELLGLQGKTIYYYENKDSVIANLYYQKDFNSDILFNEELVDNSFSVNVSKVTFKESSNVAGYPIDVYEIAGTCTAKFIDDTNGDKVLLLKDGKFNMLISRRTGL